MPTGLAIIEMFESRSVYPISVSFPRQCAHWRGNPFSPARHCAALGGRGLRILTLRTKPPPLGVDFPVSGENVCEADKRGPGVAKIGPKGRFLTERATDCHVASLLATTCFFGSAYIPLVRKRRQQAAALPCKPSVRKRWE